MHDPHILRTGYTFERCLEEFPDERFELIDGSVFMTPPPSYHHQEISANLVGELWSLLKNSEKGCRVYHAPTGLFFDNNGINKASGYVEPDLFIMCARTYKDGFVVGIPQLIIEILSPSTNKHDKIVKLNLYQKHKVNEYWIIDPANEMIDVYLLQDDRYQFPITYTKEDSLPVMLSELPKMIIDLKNIFNCG